MKIKNTVGLEWEFLVKRGNEFILPEKLGLAHDDFPLLGEARAQHGGTVSETVSNFIKTVIDVRLVLNKEKCDMVLDYGTVPLKQYITVLQSLSVKEVDNTPNIYGTVLLEQPSDTFENDGKQYRRVSTGLHIHFGREAISTHEITQPGGVTRIQEDRLPLLTLSQCKRTIRRLDNTLFKMFPSSTALSYRQPGFYQLKPYGFEYRSLPMLDTFTDPFTMMGVVSNCFEQLKRLDK